MKEVTKQICAFLLAVALYPLLALFWVIFERGNCTLSEFVNYAVRLDEI